MARVINDECIMCGACASACPESAISEGDGKYVVDMTFSVGNAGQLDQIIQSLKRLKCVNEVYRVHH